MRRHGVLDRLRDGAVSTIWSRRGTMRRSERMILIWVGMKCVSENRTRGLPRGLILRVNLRERLRKRGYMEKDPHTSNDQQEHHSHGSYEVMESWISS